MKAILQYGQFTSMIELPNFRPEIAIMKPQDELSFVSLEDRFDPAEVTTHALIFRVETQLNEDMWLYKFIREQ